MDRCNQSAQEQREPFDEQDRTIVEAFCRPRKLSIFDPFPGESTPNDFLFAPSLIIARHYILKVTEGLRRSDSTSCRVYPTFILNSQVNAFAQDLKGVEICAIYEDLAFAVYEISNFVFTQAAFFREIGNANSEISPRLPDAFQLGFWYIKYLRSGMPSYMENICEKLLPVDPDRRFMAYMLYQLMMRFIWFHELFHVVNGHTGYLSRQYEGINSVCTQYNPIYLSETEIFARSRQTMRTRHALEVDADRSAISYMYWFQQQGDEPLVDFAIKPRRLRLQLTVLAGLLSTFLFDKLSKRNIFLFDAVSNKTRRRQNVTHPTSTLRLQNMIVTLVLYDNKTDETIDVVESVFDEIERMRPNFAGIGLFSPTRIKYSISTQNFKKKFK